MVPKTTRSPHYLTHNNYSYIFRMRVPKDLQGKVGKKELRLSLKTSYMVSAKQISRLIASQIFQLFDHLRHGGYGLSNLDKEQIQQIIRKYRDHSLNRIQNNWLNQEPLTLEQAEMEIGNLESIHTDIRIALGTRDYSMAESKADDLIAENNIKGLSKDSELYKLMCVGVLNIYKSELELETSLLLGNEPSPFESSQQSEEAPNKPKAEKQTERIDVLIDQFKDENKDNWTVSTTKEAIRPLKALIENFGADTFIHQITADGMWEFRSKLSSRKNKAGQTISPKTFNKDWTFINSFFNFVKNKRKLIDTNPAADLRLPENKKRADEEQDNFEISELKEIFHSKGYLQDSFQHAHQFWLPILALFTGCRREELCQLYINDLKTLDNIVCIDIVEDNPDKHVKMHEARLVPIHPFITEELKFFNWVNSLDNQNGRIFAKLKKVNNKYGEKFGQWFSAYKKQCGIDAPPRRKTFHSFRHTLISHLMEKDVPDHVVAMLVGHKLEGQTKGRYMKRFKPDVMMEKAVLKIDFHNQIDLSHLKNSKWVVK